MPGGALGARGPRSAAGRALFKLADLPAVAKRVRPSSRRPGVTNEVERQGPDVPSDEEPAAEVTDEVSEVSAQVEPDIPPVE